MTVSCKLEIISLIIFLFRWQIPPAIRSLHLRFYVWHHFWAQESSRQWSPESNAPSKIRRVYNWADFRGNIVKARPYGIHSKLYRSQEKAMQEVCGNNTSNYGTRFCKISSSTCSLTVRGLSKSHSRRTLTRWWSPLNFKCFWNRRLL